MGSPPDGQFLHRVKRDGTFDSICRDCFATVATVLREADLAQAEKDHRCNPWMLHRYERTPPVDSN
jgi:hypothetical protein